MEHVASQLDQRIEDVVPMHLAHHLRTATLGLSGAARASSGVQVGV